MGPTASAEMCGEKKKYIVTPNGCFRSEYVAVAKRTLEASLSNASDKNPFCKMAEHPPSGEAVHQAYSSAGDKGGSSSKVA